MARTRHIERPRDGRLLGGVCVGIAERYRVDVTLVRLAFLLLSLANGIGVLVYGGLWLLTPPPGAGGRLPDVARSNLAALRGELRSSTRNLQSVWSRSRTNDRMTWPRPLDRRWLGLALIGAGAFTLLWSFGAFGWLSGARVLGLAAIAIGASALIRLQQGGR